jgi:anti-sigma B factor antagonist
VRVALTGEIDSAMAPELEKELNALLEAGHAHLVVDFGGVHFIASAGLRVFLAFAKKIQRASGKIALAGMSVAVYSVFETVGFTNIFIIHPTHEDAILAVHPQEQS